MFLDGNNARRIIAGCDAVLDGLDDIAARKVLSRACREENIPYIYGAVTGWIAQAAICMPGDRLIEKLYPVEIAVQDKSVLSFTPALCAAMQVSLCVKLLTGRSVDAGKVQYMDLLHEEYEQFTIN